MQTTERITIVSFFTDSIQANRAVEQLQQVGIRTEHIVFVVRSDMFITSGIPQEDVVYYQQVLEAGYTIMIVQADDQAAQVEHILHNNGASNARQPLSTLHKNHEPIYPDDHGIQSAWIPYGTHR